MFEYTLSLTTLFEYTLSLSRTNKVILYLCIVLFMFEYTLSLSRTINKVIICISCYSCSNTLYLSPLCSNTLYLYPAQTKLCFICTSCYSCSNALYLSPLTLFEYSLSLSRTNKVLYLCIVLFIFEYTLSLTTLYGKKFHFSKFQCDIVYTFPAHFATCRSH